MPSNVGPFGGEKSDSKECGGERAQDALDRRELRRHPCRGCDPMVLNVNEGDTTESVIAIAEL